MRKRENKTATCNLQRDKVTLYNCMCVCVFCINKNKSSKQRQFAHLMFKLMSHVFYMCVRVVICLVFVVVFILRSTVPNNDAKMLKFTRTFGK